MKFQLGIPSWKKLQLYEKHQPTLKIFQLGLKWNSLGQIETSIKVRRIIWKRGKTNQIKDGCSQQKVEITNSSIIQCYFTIITSNACSHWKVPIFKNENFTFDRYVLYFPWNSMKLLNSCKHFMRLVSLWNAIRNVLVNLPSIFFKT